MARHGYSDLSHVHRKQEMRLRRYRAQRCVILFSDISFPVRFYGEDSGVRIARKHLCWYCEQLLADSVQIRRSLMPLRRPPRSLRRARPPGGLGGQGLHARLVGLPADEVDWFLWDLK